MKRALNCIVLGVQTLPGFGPHPGNPALLACFGAGAIMGEFAGVVIAAILIVPLYISGAYARGDLYLKRKK